MNQVQTIRADSMPAALAEVRRRLGRDAVILHTRTVQTGGVLGMASRRSVEITASGSISDLPAQQRAGIVARDRDVEVSLDRAEGAAPDVIATQAPSGAGENRLLCEMRQLSGLVRQLLPVQGGDARTGTMPSIEAASGVLRAVYQNLIENRIADGLAEAIVQQIQAESSCDALQDEELVRREAARLVAAKLPVADGIDCDQSQGPKIVALVGATGVGKTTTAAKLAAEYALRRGRRVGLVTIDTHRVGAVSQLAGFAEILSIPLHVAADQQQVRDAIDELKDCDLILIDTPGVSPRDHVRLQELRHKLLEATGCETHLVLSASADRRALEEVVEAFGPIGFDRLIFTKLDESIGLGVILNCAQKVHAKLSYVTCGQDVPDDIEVAQSRRLADAIVAGAEYTS